MIRRYKPEDLDAVVQLWLSANLQAHSFVDKNYWVEQCDAVRQMLPLADIMVYTQDREICGFVGMSGNHIEGIFVASQVRSKGIGTLLLDACKQGRSTLSLAVYKQNVRAVSFYQREGFVMISQQIDGNTGETELMMRWENTAALT